MKWSVTKFFARDSVQTSAMRTREKKNQKALPTALFNIKSRCSSMPLKFCLGSKFSGNLVWPIRTTFCRFQPLTRDCFSEISRAFHRLQSFSRVYFNHDKSSVMRFSSDFGFTKVVRKNPSVLNVACLETLESVSEGTKALW